MNAALSNATLAAAASQERASNSVRPEPPSPPVRPEPVEGGVGANNGLSQTQPVQWILYVDDEPNATKWFKLGFSDQFSILTANSVLEAEQIMNARSAEIAVLLTDYRMPARNGLQLLNWAQREHRHVVRILTTAYAEKELAIAAVNQGRVQQILEKPMNEARVREALSEALASFTQRQRERAVSDSRAVALRETLGFLAHELNTPLSTVHGYMEVLRARLHPPVAGDAKGMARLEQRRAGEALAIIEAAARRTAYTQSLIATFVQSARDAYPGLEPPALQISQLVRALLDEYPFEGEERAWVGSDMVVDFSLPGRRDLLYLVACTLTKNALLALRGRAAPHLHITALMLPVPANSPLYERGRVLPSLRFSDNGPGIAPDILQRLTHEPVTTRASTGGSGMGLLFCRRVMQSLGGDIEVQSEPGQGASVTLRFAPENMARSE